MLSRSRRAAGSESASEDRRRFWVGLVLVDRATVLAGRRNLSMVEALTGTAFSLSSLVGAFLLFRGAIRGAGALTSSCRSFLDASAAAEISWESTTLSAFLFRERTISIADVRGASLADTFCATSLPTGCTFATRVKAVMLEETARAGWTAVPRLARGWREMIAPGILIDGSYDVGLGNEQPEMRCNN